MTPLIVEFTFKEDFKQPEHIPAEIWRSNEYEVTKVFALDKEVTNVVLDPNLATADTDVKDNVFPKVAVAGKFDAFKDKKK